MSTEVISMREPEVSDKAPHPRFAQTGHSAESARETSESSGVLTSAKSDVWVVLGVIALILAGMLLGAGITRLWISHAAPVAPHALTMIFSSPSATTFF